MNDSSSDSTQDDLDGQEDHGWESSVVAVDEVAEFLLQVVVEDEIEAASEQKHKEEQDNRSCDEYFVLELFRKGHKGLSEEQIGQEGQVALDNALEQEA